MAKRSFLFYNNWSPIRGEPLSNRIVDADFDHLFAGAGVTADSILDPDTVVASGDPNGDERRRRMRRQRQAASEKLKPAAGGGTEGGLRSLAQRWRAQKTLDEVSG